MIISTSSSRKSEKMKKVSKVATVFENLNEVANLRREVSGRVVDWGRVS